MRKIRIISQVVFFLLFTLAFFWLNSNPRAYSLDSETFLRLNPFTGLLTMVASRAIIMPLAIYTLVTGLLAIFFGRLFCGFICPIGAGIDFFDRFLFKKMKLEKRPPQFLQRLKYIFAAAMILLAITGALFPLFIDPLSLATRFLTFIVNPVLGVLGMELIRFTGSISSITGDHLYTLFPIKIMLYYGTAFTLFMAGLVFLGGLLDKRFWCQYICPTGAFLGIIGRFSFFRRTVNDSQCNSCSACEKKCPVRAISDHGKITNVAECIECGVCTGLKKSCSTFRISKPVSKVSTGPDFQRRHVLTGAIGGLAMVPVFKATAIMKRDDQGRLIRPPGSIPEEQFLARCLGCGECMKVCPTNTIQPCMFTDGFSRLYTPKVVPRIAGCEEKCTLCGNVCPTGAIRKLSTEDKQFVKIGTAVLDQHRCLAWEQNKECLVCDEVCPFNAIEARVVDTIKGRFKVPVVNEDLCMGCGMCEQHCPIFDTAAIVVYKFGENRRLEGPYMNEYQKNKISNLRKVSDSKNLGAAVAGELPQERSSGGEYPFDEGTSIPSDGFTE